MKIYLAGKISRNDWRNEIINTRGIKPSDINKTKDSDTYTGPYFVSCGHGCCHGDSKHGIIDVGCKNVNVEPIDESMCDKLDVVDFHGSLDWGERRDTIPKLCLSWIDDCDVLFAWIDSKDCYGTIAEIGYAYGQNKVIWIGYSNTLVMGYANRPTVFSTSNESDTGDAPRHDMWFIDRLASKVAVSPSAGLLYSMLSSQYKKTHV